MSTMPSRKVLSRISSLLGIAIGVAGVAFIVRTLTTKWAEVSEALSHMNASNLLLSVVLGLCAMTTIGALWVSMLRARSNNVAYRQAMSWYFTGQLGKYVPGGIWPIVGRAELAVRNNVARTDAYATTGLSLVTTYTGAIIAIAIGAAFTQGKQLISLGIVVLLIVGYVLFANTWLRTKAIATLSAISPSAQSLTDPQRLARLALAHVPSWILMSLSTTVTASAFHANIGVLHMLFITSTSWLVGFVVVGVPGGIGVREAVFTSLASGFIGAPIAVSIALMSRVVFIVVDLVGAFLSNIVARTSAKS